MAAAADSISIELDCAVCSDQQKQPKYIGSCNHTFCKGCIHKYWVFLEKKRTIPCPQCREECLIPSNGMDALKDNFILANIIEKYCKQQQRDVNLAEVRCTRCPNGASCFCKECDLKLCPECKRQHDHAPEKRNHDIFGFCPSHGNGLLFFCNSCKRAVCGGCKVSNHDEGKHDVTPICPVVGNLMSRIQASSSELEDAIRTQVEEQEMQLSQLRGIIQQKSTSAKVQATASAERTIAAQRKEIGGLKAVSLCIQNQINALVKKKEEVDECIKQRIEVADNREKEKTKIIADVIGRFTKSSEEIDQRLLSLDTRRKEMVAKILLGRAVVSTKITIDNESIANFSSMSQELVDLVRASREGGTTVIEEVRRSIRELGLDIGDMGKDLGVMSGDQHIKMCKTKRDFKQLKKVCRVTSQSEEVYRLKHVHVPDSRLATLGNHSGDWANMIHFHDIVTSALTSRIESGVYPANDMVASSTGELVVVRNETPPIRVFNPATGAYRDINITHDAKVIVRLWHVTAESDNMFVLTGCYDPLLLVAKPNGNVIHSAQLRGYVDSVAFCPLSRVLYIAACDRILRFHWINNILKEISPYAHGVEGFTCHDVCIGSGGEVLVAGCMRNNYTVIYQVTESEDEKDLVWRNIEQDGANRYCEYGIPHICVNDDNLWLGYNRDDNDGTIEKFQLV